MQGRPKVRASHIVFLQPIEMIEIDAFRAIGSFHTEQDDFPFLEPMDTASLLFAPHHVIPSCRIIGIAPYLPCK